MKKLIIGAVVVVVIAGLSLAYYYLIYKPGLISGGSNAMDGSPCTISGTVSANRDMAGTIKNGKCVPAGSVGSNGRMTAIQANDILNTYAIKDSLGYPTLNYNGATFDKPNLSSFPNASLQSLLNNGWWLALLTGGTTNGFQTGDNGNYLVAIYDLRDVAASINNGKSKVTIPASLKPYLII